MPRARRVSRTRLSARTCAESWSSDAARRSVSSLGERPEVDHLLDLGVPLVTVPVLSSRTVVAAPRRSRTPAPFTMIPARAARESPPTNAIGAARISGHGVATTITASHLFGSPVAAHAMPPTTSEKGRKTAAYRSASRVNFARSLSAVRTSRTIAAYALSAADRVTRASNAFPAFAVPDRTSPPAGIVTGSASPVSADSSTTACVLRRRRPRERSRPRARPRVAGRELFDRDLLDARVAVAMRDPRRPLDRGAAARGGPAPPPTPRGPRRRTSSARRSRPRAARRGSARRRSRRARSRRRRHRRARGSGACRASTGRGRSRRRDPRRRPPSRARRAARGRRPRRWLRARRPRARALSCRRPIVAETGGRRRPVCRSSPRIVTASSCP